jgi:hypothetical protein
MEIGRRGPIPPWPIPFQARRGGSRRAQIAKKGGRCEWRRAGRRVVRVLRPQLGGFEVAIRLRGTGKGSGVEIDRRGFWVYELRGDRLYRISEYNDRAEALEAAGLGSRGRTNRRGRYLATLGELLAKAPRRAVA